jgi:aspartate/methionine/tyrosine aminotransferase
LQAGIPGLREKIAGDYAHMNLNIDQVVVTAGSQESLYLILRTLVEAGDEVLMPDPGFIAYPMITKMVGGKEIRYRLPASRDFGFDIDDFKKKISSRTKAVICISPSNPTGRALSRDDLQAMADAVTASGSNAYIISDEIYRELYYTPERPASISEFYPRSISYEGRAGAAWVHGNLRVEHFAESRAGCVDRRSRGRPRRVPRDFSSPARSSNRGIARRAWVAGHRT